MAQGLGIGGRWKQADPRRRHAPRTPCLVWPQLVHLRYGTTITTPSLGIFYRRNRRQGRPDRTLRPRIAGSLGELPGVRFPKRETWDPVFRTTRPAHRWPSIRRRRDWERGRGDRPRGGNRRQKPGGGIF